MTTLSITAEEIIAPDGTTVVRDPYAPMKWWNYDQVYFGLGQNGKFVPNVDDALLNYTTGRAFRVVRVDPVSLIPDLQDLYLKSAPDVDESASLTDNGPTTYRVYLDRSVTPYRLTVDQRFSHSGTDAMYAKIFKGSELAGNEQVISMVFDASNNFVGNQIPLALIAMTNSQNIATKSVPPCRTTADLVDEELVSVVIYGASGSVVVKKQMTVSNTAFISDGFADTEYIEMISVESPFLSEGDPDLILYPMNLPLNGFNIRGVVHYSSGRKKTLPVDGNKFVMMGLNEYIASVPNQTIPVTLRYLLGPNEKAANATIVSGTAHLARDYTIMTTQVDGVHQVKLFCYPVWINAISGYRLEWFMYNLERQTYWRVTPYVTVRQGTNPFDPILYGIRQNLTVQINLKSVNSSFRDYNHVQTFVVTLLKAHENDPLASADWTVADYGAPAYGEQAVCRMKLVNANLRYLNFGSDYDTVDEWLKGIYNAVNPLIDSQKEEVGKPPRPDYFIITTPTGNDIEVPIDSFRSEITVTDQFYDGDTIFIRFVRRFPESDLQLAAVGMTVRQVQL